MSSEGKNLLHRFSEDCDQDAFSELVRQHIGLVYHSALRRTEDAHASEDITQQVFLLLARKARQVSAHEALIGWLHTATRLETQNYLRRERRRTSREKEAAMNIDATDSTPQQDWERLRPTLDAALDELDTADRDAVLLRFFANQPFAAIGRQLGVTENAARMRVGRALDKLHAILGANNITSVALAAALASEAVAASAPSTLATQVTAHVCAITAANTSTTLVFTMTSSKLVVTAAIALAALGIGAAWYQTRAATVAQDSLTATIRRLTDAQVQLQANARDLTAALTRAKSGEERIAALETELAHVSSSGQKTGESSPAVASTKPTKQWSNPDYARLLLENFRLSLRTRFEPLYRSLNLTSEQIAAFEAIQVDSQREIYEIWAAADAAGVETGRDTSIGTAVTRLTGDPNATKRDKLKALLGAEAFKTYDDFESPKNHQATTFVTGIAGALFSSSQPLNPDQGTKLVQAIAANTQIVKEPMANDGGQPMYRLMPQTNWAAVNAAAATFLSSDQVEVLKSRSELEEVNRKLNALYYSK